MSLASTKPKKKYVVWETSSRKGEFAFNCNTQNHLFSLREAQVFIKEELEYQDSDDIDTFKFKIYKITLKEVK